MAACCPKCGAAVEEGWPVCRSCFEPLKREGLLGRLARFFVGGLPRQVDVRINESIKIRSSSTGEIKEYRSLDDVPQDFREQIRQLRQAALSGDGKTTITITDSSGNVQTYRS